MSDECKKKPLVEAIAEALKKESSEEISPTLVRECEMFEAEMKKNLTSAETKRTNPVRYESIDAHRAAMKGHLEGLFVHRLPVEVLGGVLHSHYYHLPSDQIRREGALNVFFGPMYRVRQPRSYVRAITVH